MTDDGTSGGSQQCLTDLASRLRASSYDPIVLLYQQTRHVEQLSSLGVEVHVWRREPPARPPFKLLRNVGLTAYAIARRVAFVRQHRIDLVHLNNSPGGGYDDWVPAAKLSGRAIITHARAPFSLPSFSLWRTLATRFDAVIAISDFMLRSAVEAGLPAGRIVRIHDGIDATAYARTVSRSRAAVRAELGVDESTQLVLMPGHLRRWKGQHKVLRALALLPPADRERIRVVFAGAAGKLNGAYFEELRRTRDELGLERTVQFLGERSDVADLINASDLVLHASIEPEPFGLVIVEAMALGKALIASNRGGPSEIVTPASGVLVDAQSEHEIADAVRRLISSEALRQKLGSGARARVNEFSLDATVRNVEAVYARLIRKQA